MKGGGRLGPVRTGEEGGTTTELEGEETKEGGTREVAGGGGGCLEKGCAGGAGQGEMVDATGEDEIHSLAAPRCLQGEG